MMPKQNVPAEHLKYSWFGLGKRATDLQTCEYPSQPVMRLGTCMPRIRYCHVGSGLGSDSSQL